MLMMSRREGETILIGEEIEVVIAHIGRSRVKVGIRAPRAMAVVAREVKLVREENLAAAERAAGAALGSLVARFKRPSQASGKRADEGSVRQEAGN
jgi:carbon storage regulator